MIGLSFADIAVIILYFGIIIGIGVWASRKIRDEEDFLLGGRGFGKLVQTFASFGSGTSVENAVGVVTTTFTNGASGMWSAMLTLFATPVYWFTSVWMRRLRILTAGDFFKERYGSGRMAGAYALIGTLSMMAVMAVGFAAMAKTVAAMLPKEISQLTAAETAEYQRAYEMRRQIEGERTTGRRVLTISELLERNALQPAAEAGTLDAERSVRWAALQPGYPAKSFSLVTVGTLVWVVCAITLIYTVAGGLMAAFLAEVVQGTFIIIMSVLLIPFAWARINAIYGGDSPMDALRTMHERLPGSFFEIFGSPAAADFTWYYIAALSVMVTLSVVIQPNMLVTSGAAKDEYSARYGMVSGNFMKRACTLLWGMFALSAVVLYGGTITDPDLVWGHATRDLLGPLGLGLVGLMIACLMSALMSTVATLMLSCAGLLTQNIYRPALPGRGESHYVAASRLLGILVVIGSAWIALQFETILQLLKFVWELMVVLVPAFWLGIKWRRANRLGAWASICVGAILFIVFPVLIPSIFPSLRHDPRLLLFTEPITIERTYEAGRADVVQRAAEIEQWNHSGERDRSVHVAPVPLKEGERFTKSYTLDRRPIFWTTGIKLDDQGQMRGQGALSLDLVALHAAGVDLTANPYALNETLRLIIRTLLPILLMVLISLLTPPDPRELLDRFFAKMRTPVEVERAKDDAELALSYRQPDRYHERLLFPGSNWEFFRWTRQDATGFLLACALVGAVLLTMQAIATVGS